MKQFFLILVLFFIAKGISAQENYLPLLEPSIGLSQTELKVFLKGVLKGKEAVKANIPGQDIYNIDNADIYADYYIHKDTCLQVLMIFKNSGVYQAAAAQIISTSMKLKGHTDMYSKLSQNGKTIYFSIDNKMNSILAIEKKWFTGQ